MDSRSGRNLRAVAACSPPASEAGPPQTPPSPEVEYLATDEQRSAAMAQDELGHRAEEPAGGARASVGREGHEVSGPIGGWFFRFKRTRDLLQRCCARFVEQMPAPPAEADGQG